MTIKYAKNYISHYQSYKGERWCYEDGCVLMGAKQLFEATQDADFKTFVINWLNHYVQADGSILSYQEKDYNVDDINEGKTLFFAYDQTKEEKYRLAMDVLMHQLKNQPRTPSGNFFHKNQYPNQIWLDGLYMAEPFYMEYETRYDHKNGYNDVLNQFQNVRKYLRNAETQLYYHACDESKSIFWANPETGCSANYWLRSMGWYLMALVDVMDVMSPEIYEQYDAYKQLYQEAIQGMLLYQDPTSKCFYQVIDHPEAPGNYLETSGTSMVAYSILKAVRLGVLSQEKYLDKGKEIFDELTKRMLVEKDGKVQLNNICSVAGLGPESNPKRDGSVAYYLSEPIVSDDAKGVGPWMMALAERLKACETASETEKVRGME